MERRPTRRRTTLAVSVLALTLIAPWVLGQDPDTITEIRLQAEQGDAYAQYNLGFRYDFGLGVPQDDAEAVRWYRLSADQGNTFAQSSLGFMYAFGQGVPQDDAEAVRWYRLSADQGDASAQYNLGVRYANGVGVLKDDAEAVRWYRLSADQGNAGRAVQSRGQVRQRRGCPQGRCRSRALVSALSRSRERLRAK